MEVKFMPALALSYQKIYKFILDNAHHCQPLLSYMTLAKDLTIDLNLITKKIIQEGYFSGISTVAMEGDKIIGILIAIPYSQFRMIEAPKVLAKEEKMVINYLCQLSQIYTPQNPDDYVFRIFFNTMDQTDFFKKMMNHQDLIEEKSGFNNYIYDSQITSTSNRSQVANESESVKASIYLKDFEFEGNRLFSDQNLSKYTLIRSIKF